MDILYKALFRSFLFVVIILFQNTNAQNLSGIVSDENNLPLQNVNVIIPALHRGFVTDNDGKFVIENLKSGTYIIEFSMIGFKKETRLITIASSNIIINVNLTHSALELPGIIITGTPQPSDILSLSQSITVVEDRELNELRGQNIIQVIENTPGVSSYTTGAGIAKPVIRGLTSQRVLVISDGIRQEGQQWGDEHGLEIDVFDVERIEVLRGPSSVLYGSDALGGVINIIKHDLPSRDEGYNMLGGNIILNGFSNNRSTAGDFSLFGTSKNIGYRGHLSFRNAKDISTPAGRLFNSGLYELNGGGLIGTKGAWGAASIDYSSFGQKIQIHENPAESFGATPFQKIQHNKIHFHADFPAEVIRLEFDGSWQKNIRQEFEEKDATVPEIKLQLNTYSLDIKGHHKPINPIFGTIGFSIMTQNNKSLAEEKLIPGFKLLNIAGFIYEEAQLNYFNLSAGIRYDRRILDILTAEEPSVEATRKNFNAFSGTIGLVYRISEPAAIAVNIGRGWRAPTPFELYVDGIHEGTIRYETGDKNLKNESSLNTDLSIRYVTHKFKGEITFFRNQIMDYIYLSPTGEIDEVSGFPKYLNKQADAILTGIELSFSSQVNNWMILTGGYNLLSGTNDETKSPLPLLPANQATFGLRLFTKSLIKRILSPYLSLDTKIISSQNRIEKFETSTSGYTLFDIGTGCEIAVGHSQANLDFSIENLFNKSYRNHLNRYKTYALNPGRNFTIKFAVPFVLVK